MTHSSTYMAMQAGTSEFFRLFCTRCRDERWPYGMYQVFRFACWCKSWCDLPTHGGCVDCPVSFPIFNQTLWCTENPNSNATNEIDNMIRVSLRTSVKFILDLYQREEMAPLVCAARRMIDPSVLIDMPFQFCAA